MCVQFVWISLSVWNSPILSFRLELSLSLSSLRLELTPLSLSLRLELTHSLSLRLELTLFVFVWNSLSFRLELSLSFFCLELSLFFRYMQTQYPCQNLGTWIKEYEDTLIQSRRFPTDVQKKIGKFQEPPFRTIIQTIQR